MSVNGGEHNWQTGQQVMHRSQEGCANPQCMIVVAGGTHPDTHELMYNVQWVNDAGELRLASVPEIALTHWREKH